MNDLYTGKLTRLAALEPEKAAHEFITWDRNALYLRLLNSSPATPFTKKTHQEWLEKDLKTSPLSIILFGIRTLQEDKLVGFFELYPIWNHQDAWLGIGIGEEENWGRGFGSDAMQTGLRYAFRELNLERVSLGVYGYNQRAQGVYEKVGFKLEGTQREALFRDGKRHDALFMGILKEEWELLNQ